VAHDQANPSGRRGYDLIEIGARLKRNGWKIDFLIEKSVVRRPNTFRIATKPLISGLILAQRSLLHLC
jgi:hypothetical protein